MFVAGFFHKRTRIMNSNASTENFLRYSMLKQYEMTDIYVEFKPIYTTIELIGRMLL